MLPCLTRSSSSSYFRHVVISGIGTVSSQSKSQVSRFPGVVYGITAIEESSSERSKCKVLDTTVAELSETFSSLLVGKNDKAARLHKLPLYYGQVEMPTSTFVATRGTTKLRCYGETSQFKYECPTAPKTVVPIIYTVPGAEVTEKEVPGVATEEKVEPVRSDVSLEMPQRLPVEEIIAKGKMPCGMIKIRRSKMNKHKLKKLKKKMRFAYRRVKQKRIKRKEKALQKELALVLHGAEEFDAEQHVKSTLNKYNDVVYWQNNPVKGKRLRMPPGFQVIPKPPVQSYE
ncbi:PREDICTED: uncharacterized protein LOC106821228 [Priapulus caudatus]|uniref:Uncharacterized protein LOC106821228 n=1 Tax=Priapulus caudatus TaxID=37621 RepID=A0ABM1FAF5_PRICU|nr:PREDICTED: uncharacterized protein LOC106821228 [Priapulus caudatus]